MDKLEKISGSKYYRAYCVECKEPIRVPYEIDIGSLCDECRGVKRVQADPLTPRQKIGRLKIALGDEFNNSKDGSRGSDNF